MALVSVVWVMVGYSLAFDAGNTFIGGLRFAFLRDVGAAPMRNTPRPFRTPPGRLIR